MSLSDSQLLRSWPPKKPSRFSPVPSILLLLLLVVCRWRAPNQTLTLLVPGNGLCCEVARADDTRA